MCYQFKNRLNGGKCNSTNGENYKKTFLWEEILQKDSRIDLNYNYKFYKKLLKTVLDSDIITLIKVNEEVPNIKGVLLVMQARPIRKQHINVCYFLMGLFYLLKFIN
jgi:hypothetical protein